MLDIELNRSSQKWSRNELIGRVAWGLTRPLFTYSPRVIWPWRRLLLRLFGAKIGKQVRINPNVSIMMPWNLVIDDYAGIGDRVILYALGEIRVGARATISQGAHLCAGTHDYREVSLPLRKCKIVIEEGAWICADAFIGPDVVIGTHAVVGARAVVVKNVGSNKIVAGNPAKEIGSRWE